MNQDVYRTLYCSRNWIQGDQAEQIAEVNSILQVAREKNGRHNVTGALLFNSGYFAQVLEGPRQAIEQIFETIQRDQRHGEVIVLETGYAATRDFSDWSMAYVQPPLQEHASDVGLALNQALLKPEESAGAVLDLLRTLVVQED